MHHRPRMSIALSMSLSLNYWERQGENRTNRVFTYFLWNPLIAAVRPIIFHNIIVHFHILIISIPLIIIIYFFVHWIKMSSSSGSSSSGSLLSSSLNEEAMKFRAHCQKDLKPRETKKRCNSWLPGKCLNRFCNCLYFRHAFFGVPVEVPGAQNKLNVLDGPLHFAGLL